MNGKRVLPLLAGVLLLASCATSSDPYYSARDPYVYGRNKEALEGGAMLGSLLGGPGGAAIGGMVGGILGDLAGSGDSR